MLAFLVRCQWQCILRFPHPGPLLCIGGMKVFIILIVSLVNILTLNVTWIECMIGIFMIFFTACSWYLQKCLLVLVTDWQNRHSSKGLHGELLIMKNKFLWGTVWGSHDSDYGEICLLGGDTMWFGVNRYQHLRGLCSLHLQDREVLPWRWKQPSPLNY